MSKPSAEKPDALMSPVILIVFNCVFKFSLKPSASVPDVVISPVKFRVMTLTPAPISIPITSSAGSISPVNV